MHEGDVSEEIMMTGISLIHPLWIMLASTSNPSMLGMTMSSSTSDMVVPSFCMAATP